MALEGIELEMLVSELDALTTTSFSKLCYLSSIIEVYAS